MRSPNLALHCAGLIGPHCISGYCLLTSNTVFTPNDGALFEGLEESITQQVVLLIQPFLVSRYLAIHLQRLLVANLLVKA